MYVMEGKPAGGVVSQKSLFVAYLCWLFGGLFGLHHFYLHRDVHAFLTWATIGGYFGFGWLRDAVKLPEYVKDANEEPNYMRQLIERMRTQSKPVNSWSRGVGTVIVANTLGYLVIGALPTDYLRSHPTFFLQIKQLVVPLAVAIGVFTVGNVGRHQGSFKFALIGAYLASPLIYVMVNPIVYISIFSSIVFNRYGKQWKRTPAPRRSFWRRIAFLALLTILYLQLWVGWFCFNCETTNNEGENVKCVDSLVDFFHSPSWKQFKSAMSELKLYIQIHGIRGLYQNLKAWSGEDLEKEAYEVLDLKPNATPDEITKKYRKLVRQWHPDKQKNEVAREEAQEKFIAIIEAYQVLMKVHKGSDFDA